MMHGRSGSPAVFAALAVLTLCAIGPAPGAGHTGKQEPAAWGWEWADEETRAAANAVAAAYYQAWGRGDVATMYSLCDARTRRWFTYDMFLACFTLYASPVSGGAPTAWVVRPVHWTPGSVGLCFPNPRGVPIAGTLGNARYSYASLLGSSLATLLRDLAAGRADPSVAGAVLNTWLDTHGYSPNPEFIHWALSRHSGSPAALALHSRPESTKRALSTLQVNESWAYPLPQGSGPSSPEMRHLGWEPVCVAAPGIVNFSSIALILEDGRWKVADAVVPVALDYPNTIYAFESESELEWRVGPNNVWATAWPGTLVDTALRRGTPGPTSSPPREARR